MEVQGQPVSADAQATTGYPEGLAQIVDGDVCISKWTFSEDQTDF